MLTAVSHDPTTVRYMRVAGERKGCRIEKGKMGDEARIMFDRDDVSPHMST